MGAFATSEPACPATCPPTPCPPKRSRTVTAGFCAAGNGGSPTPSSPVWWWCSHALGSADDLHRATNAPGVAIGSPTACWGIVGRSPPMFISTTSAAPGFGARTGRGGLRIALQILIYGRIGIGAARVGMAQAAFDRTVYHLKSRHAFGASLASRQHWQFVMADYAADLECAPCISKRHCGSTSASGSPNPRRRWRNCGARIWPRGSSGMPCRPSVDSALCGRSAPTAQGPGGGHPP